MNLGLLKKHIMLVTTAVVTVVALGLAGWKLVLLIRDYMDAKDALSAAMGRLQSMYERTPYPSQRNVVMESLNYDDTVDMFNELNELLRVDQVETREMESADFMRLLENTLRQLRDLHRAQNIQIPAKYAFGFDKYAGGLLPAPHDIPQLAQQLKIIDVLCRRLVDSGITELISVTREDVESTSKAPADPRKSRGGAAPASDKLFTLKHFKLEFKAKELAVIDVLNRMAAQSMFTVITAVELSNPRQSMRDATTGGAKLAVAAAGKDPKNDAKTAATSAPLEELPREQRVLTGKEETSVKMDVDVYQFAPSLAVRATPKRR